MSLSSLPSINLLMDSINIPTAAIRGFNAFHKIHCLWRWHRNVKEIYTNSENFKKLLAGHALHLVMGESFMLQLAAQATLIARRLVDLSQQKTCFVYAYKDWSYAIRCKTFICIPHGKVDLCKVLSPSSVLTWKVYQQRWLITLQRIALCTFFLLQEAFKLSMCLIDVIEAFSLSRSQIDANINEIFIHSSKLVDNLVEQKDELHMEFMQHKDVIDNLLTQLNAPFKVEDLAANIDKAIDVTENIAHITKRIPNKVTRGLKEGLYTFLHATSGWAPNILVNQSEEHYDNYHRFYPSRSSRGKERRGGLCPTTYT